MRISDWSSDVCSSDLGQQRGNRDIEIDRIHALPEDAFLGATLEQFLDGLHDRVIKLGHDFGLLHVPRFMEILAGEKPDEFRHFNPDVGVELDRSEEQTSELQSLMRNSYAFFCLKKTNNTHWSSSDAQQSTTQPCTSTRY